MPVEQIQAKEKMLRNATARGLRAHIIDASKTIADEAKEFDIGWPPAKVQLERAERLAVHAQGLLERAQALVGIEDDGK